MKTDKFNMQKRISHTQQLIISELPITNLQLRTSLHNINITVKIYSKHKNMLTF